MQAWKSTSRTTHFSNTSNYLSLQFCFDRYGTRAVIRALIGGGGGGGGSVYSYIRVLPDEFFLK